MATQRWRRPLAAVLSMAAVGSASIVEQGHGGSQSPILLDLSNLEYSNLGGAGPSHGVPEELRFTKVAEFDGASVDLAIACAEDGCGDQHGKLLGPNPNEEMNPTISRLGFSVGSEVRLVAKLIRQGDSKPVKLPEFFFSVLDLDIGPDDEHLEIGGFKEVFLTRDSLLAYRMTPDGRIFFQASGGEDVPSPEAADKLTDGQRQRAVSFLFEDSSGFEFSVGCADSHPGGACTLIFGSSELEGAFGMLPRASSSSGGFDSSDADSGGEGEDRYMCFATFDVEMWSDAQKDYCCSHHPSLGRRVCGHRGSGAGAATEPAVSDAGKEIRPLDMPAAVTAAPTPSTTFPPYTGCGRHVSCEIRLSEPSLTEDIAGHSFSARFAHVCDDEEAGPIDLVLKGEKPANGKHIDVSLSGPYGQVHLPMRTTGDFRARLVRAGTDEEVKLRSFFFSLINLGGDADGSEEEQTEVVMMHGISTYIVESNGPIHHTALEGGVSLRAASSPHGAGRDVPADPLQCTEAQAGRTAVMLFKDVSEFPISFAVEDSASRPTTFLFGGRSCLSEHCDNDGGAAEADEQESYDCGAWLESWRSTWTFAKKRWCCEHKGVNCYVCSGSPVSWMEDGGQREYCCRANVGACEPGGGISGDVDHLSAAQQAEAAAVAANAIAAAAEVVKASQAARDSGSGYDCLQEAEVWEYSWSPEKQVYCCQTAGIACGGSSMRFQRKFSPGLRKPSRTSATLVAIACPLAAAGMLSLAAYGLVLRRRFSLCRTCEQECGPEDARRVMQARPSEFVEADDLAAPLRVVEDEAGLRAGERAREEGLEREEQ